MIDLKSDPPEKDRLHFKIFGMTKINGEKMAVDEGSVDANDTDRIIKRRRKMRRTRGRDE